MNKLIQVSIEEDIFPVYRETPIGLLLNEQSKAMMETKLEGIAAKALSEPKLVFTSLAHHVTKELIWESMGHISNDTAPGIDGIDAKTAKKTFKVWVDEMIASIHRKSYKPPAVRRVWIPKPGKAEKRPIGVPCIADRALQRSVAKVLNAIYEQDFLNCSFGGRPGRSAHNALASLNETIGCKKVNWVFEADLKNFFGSLNHGWLLKFVEHRVGDQRIINLIRRWLKAGVIEDGNLEVSEVGTPQGGSISVLLSNLYLHYVLDLWYEKVVRPKMKGESYLIRYIDDFMLCFQYKEDADRFRQVLEERLTKFSLQLEPNKTRLVRFGRFAPRDIKGEKPETIYFLGFTHYCTITRSGKFMVGRKTEKSRLKRSLARITDKMKEMQHWSIKEQVYKINEMLRGHYNYYGMGGNLKSLQRVHRVVERYWWRLLCGRSWRGYIRWNVYVEILKSFPILRPRIHIPLVKMKQHAML
ncbi:group II intron reverse transcriptase/maturase [Desulfosporosinus burensis]